MLMCVRSIYYFLTEIVIQFATRNYQETMASESYLTLDHLNKKCPYRRTEYVLLESGKQEI